VSVGFDPSTDFEDITDGLEAITLDRRGSSDNVSVTAALQRMISTTEVVASNGKLQSGDVRWHLPNAQVTTTPRMGDWIVDASANRWQILQVDDATLQNRWMCAARNLRIAYGLDDTITIERATYAKGTAGAIEEDYKIHKTGVRARIQETAADMEIEAGARRTTKEVTILLEEDVTILQTDRIEDRRGTLYRVEGTVQQAEIGQPFVIGASEWRL
jgi:hypothetical protein